jgi:hypothetical protein
MTTARKPTPAEIASIAALADKLATDEKFAHKVAQFKPGDEKKLEQALAEAGFKGFGVTIALPAFHFCFTVAFVVRICVTYEPS